MVKYSSTNIQEKGDKLDYKLLALDLDGTLLNSDGQLSEKNIEAVKKAQDAGVVVVLATGRYYMQTERIINQLDFKGVLVSNDGAVSINTDTKKVIHQFSFSIHEIAPLINYCRKYDIHFSLCTAFDFFVETIDEQLENSFKKYEITHTLHDDVLQLKEGIIKFTIDDRKQIGGWQDIQLPTKNLRIRDEAEFAKEFVHINTYKTNGLKNILQFLGLNSSKMIAIGDYYNDVDMIEFAGLGIAMGNAPDDLKKKANDVTLSNDEDGVYHAIEKYIFNS
jgi:Cof subfamily protein (haloacid dehalogenase superfamily)